MNRMLDTLAPPIAAHLDAVAGRMTVPALRPPLRRLRQCPVCDFRDSAGAFFESQDTARCPHCYYQARMGAFRLLDQAGERWRR